MRVEGGGFVYVEAEVDAPADGAVTREDDEASSAVAEVARFLRG